MKCKYCMVQILCGASHPALPSLPSIGPSSESSSAPPAMVNEASRVEEEEGADREGCRWDELG